MAGQRVAELVEMTATMKVVQRVATKVERREQLMVESLVEMKVVLMADTMVLLKVDLMVD